MLSTETVDAQPEVEVENTEEEIVEENVEEVSTEAAAAVVEVTETTTEENNEEEVVAPTTEESTPPKPAAKKQIFCGNISYSSTEEGIKSYFAQFGEVANILLAKKKQAEGAGHRGFAFISYTDKEVAKAVLGMADHKLDGRSLTIKEAKPKTTKFFVGGLDRDKTDAESLRKFFETFGEIEDCFCPNNKKFGFVTMVEDGDNIQRILEAGNFEIDGTTVDVKPAQPKKEDMPRHRGMGFGAPGGYPPYGGYGGRPPMGGGWGYARYRPYPRGGGYGGGRRGYN